MSAYHNIHTHYRGIRPTSLFITRVKWWYQMEEHDERDESLAINLPAADARIIADRALLHVVSVEVA